MESDPLPADAGLDTDADLAAERGPFFRRVDWGAFYTVFGLSLLAYGLTCAPTVTLEDSGELVVAADYLGVPHPPGYPIWTLLAWLFQWIFGFVTYHGHPNPAWGVAFCSAFFGALANGGLALLLCRSGRDLLRSMPRFNEVLGARGESLLSWSAAVAGGLTLAFSSVMWSQAVIAEVYTLNAFFQIFVLLLLYRWLRRPEETGALLMLGFVFGLGFTNHQTLIFLGLALAAVILVRSPDLFRAFFLCGLPLAAAVGFQTVAGKALALPEDATGWLARWAVTPHLDRWPWTAGPDHPGFWVWSAVAVVPLLLFALRRGPTRTAALTLLLFLVGAAFYGFMPIASEQNPPMNWGYPRTWEGFLHAISRGQYEQLQPGNPFSLRFAQQVGIYLTDLRGQFTLPLALLGFLPFSAWSVTVRGRRFGAFLPALGLALAASALSGVEFAFGAAAPAALMPLYKLLTLAVLALGGLGLLIALVELTQRILEAIRTAGALTAFVLGLLVVGVGAAWLFVDFQLLRLLFREPVGTRGTLAVLALIAGPPAAAGLILAGRRAPWALAFDAPPLLQGWLAGTLAGFAGVSVIFIAINNIAMDVQSRFIGRVQFIQSHALFALWLGYGLLFALAFAARLVRGRRGFAAAAAGLALLLPGALLAKNWLDRDAERVLGGAEQNGHDFGWRFGHHALRGVRGIEEDLRAELAPEEFARVWATYPDKSYPPEMTPNAIFFGGTDPGRFVPTYMIYSAKVRPDVFLITQNALADGTYLNVMRDLYGDRIFIPASLDTNRAFLEFDARSGDAPGEVRKRSGAIAVQGVQQVMEINGILARQMFDADKRRHDFYVEESYQIPWMNPHLAPHGLILKLNAEPGDLSPALVRQDREFWDWYARRLGATHAFRRDVNAQKAFSKLRGSIAGVYATRAATWTERAARAARAGRTAEAGDARQRANELFGQAEYAFRQAIAMCPLSPEARGRIVAEVLVPQGRIADARAVLAEFLRDDPLSAGLSEMDRSLSRYLELRGRFESGALFADLRAALRAGGPGPGKALQERADEPVELARLAWTLADTNLLTRLAESALKESVLPPRVYVTLAGFARQSGQYDLAERHLRALLKLLPDELSAWLELVTVQRMGGHGDQARQNLQQVLTWWIGRPEGEPMEYFQIGQAAMDERWPDLAETALQTGLDRQARKGERPELVALMLLARARMQLNKPAEAAVALRQALAIGDRATRRSLLADPAFRPILNRLQDATPRGSTNPAPALLSPAPRSAGVPPAAPAP